MTRLFALILTAMIALMTLPARANDAAIEGMQEYMMFTEYEAGIILPEQIDEDVFNAVLFIDVRDAEQFAEAHIPSAINIEWREVLDRIDEIPTDRKVIVYCNTGTISS